MSLIYQKLFADVFRILIIYSYNKSKNLNHVRYKSSDIRGKNLNKKIDRL